MRIWAVLATAAASMSIAAIVFAARPLGRAVDEHAKRECAPGAIAFFPSDPLPRSDPEYAVSEECHQRSKRAAGLASLFCLAAATVGLVALAIHVRRAKTPTSAGS